MKQGHKFITAVFLHLEQWVIIALQAHKHDTYLDLIWLSQLLTDKSP